MIIKKNCKICLHAKRFEIESDLNHSELSFAKLAKKHKLSVSSLWRHNKRHAPFLSSQMDDDTTLEEIIKIFRTRNINLDIDADGLPKMPTELVLLIDWLDRLRRKWRKESQTSFRLRNS